MKIWAANQRNARAYRDQAAETTALERIGGIGQVFTTLFVQQPIARLQIAADPVNHPAQATRGAA